MGLEAAYPAGLPTAPQSCQHLAMASIEPRTLRLATLVVCLCCLTACWELPTEHSLHFHFLADGGLRATLVVEFVDEPYDDAGKERRALEVERLLSGSDSWSPRFEALRPSVEEVGWQKVEGALRHFQRVADVSPGELVAPEGALERFWRGTPVYSTYDHDKVSGLAEWAIFPGGSDRATRREERRIDEALTRWSADIATYLLALDELYAYLDLHPDRALLCLATLFESDDDLPPIHAEEQRLLEALADSLTPVLDIFDRPRDEAESLEEVSRRVFDPFGARISAEIPGAPVEQEGFVADGDRWLVPGLSFWSALRHLENRWAEPNLLVEAFEAEIQDREVNPIALADAPRRSDPPVGADEVEDALRAALTPAGVYRLAWRLH